jgi:hypothetical protein
MTGMIVLWALLLVSEAEKAEKTVKLVDLQPIFALVSNPVAFSPDGKKLLTLSRGRKDGLTYWIADANGENSRLLFVTPVDWNDAITGSFGSSVFSPDGKKVAVLTTKDGKLFRKEKDRLRAAYCDLEGQVTKVEAEGDAVSCAFAGERLAFLDGDASGSTIHPGYKLKIWDGKAASTLHEGPEVATSLVASPDGSRLAFLCGFPPGRETLIRVVELKSGKLIDSEKFPTRRVSFDGPPLIHWDHDGKGLFHHQVHDQDGKRKCSLAWFYVEKKTTETLLDRKGLALAAVLDQEHLLLSDFDKGISSILRRSDRKISPLPRGTFVLGGSGKKLVVCKAEELIPRVVEFQLPLE